MDTFKTRSKIVTATQKQIIEDFMRTYPNLAVGRYTKVFTQKTGQRLWMQLAIKLNAVPNGSYKHWRQWRKVWQDLRHRERKLSRLANGEVEELDSKLEIVVPKLEPEDLELGTSLESSSSDQRTMPVLYSAPQTSSNITSQTITSNEPPPLTFLEPPKLVPLTNKTAPASKHVDPTLPTSSSTDSERLKYSEDLLNVKWAKVNALERIATALEAIANRGELFDDPISTNN